jgi:hypothetical protein
MLPNVVILGHCCMLWAAQLQEVGHIFSQQQQAQEPSNSQDQPLQGEQVQCEVAEWSEFLLAQQAHSVQQWLAAGSTCEQLTTAGYAPQTVQQHLEQLLATYEALKDDPPASAAPLLAAAQQLQSTGLALCSFAVPCMCNNPGCTSLSGLSELAS